MLSSVLRSSRAATVNIGIMRAFVKLREMLASPAIWHTSLQKWKSGTMRSSKWYSTPSGS